MKPQLTNQQEIKRNEIIGKLEFYLDLQQRCPEEKHIPQQIRHYALSYHELTGEYYKR